MAQVIYHLQYLDEQDLHSYSGPYFHQKPFKLDTEDEKISLLVSHHRGIRRQGRYGTPPNLLSHEPFWVHERRNCAPDSMSSISFPHSGNSRACMRYDITRQTYKAIGSKTVMTNLGKGGRMEVIFAR